MASTPTNYDYDDYEDEDEPYDEDYTWDEDMPSWGGF